VLILRVLVFHPSRCELTVIRINVVVSARFGMVKTVEIHQVMWFIMLKSTKD
jgi:phage shock protein PspC (stress-responsive transcriptional regulator)